MRPRTWYVRPACRVVVTWIIGGVLSILGPAGCGGPESAETLGSLPAKADPSDPSTSVATSVPGPAGAEPVGRSEDDVFPTWPSGDVRREGLTTYRVDVTPLEIDEGTLKFMKGDRVLFEAPFKPKHVKTIEPLPSPVTDSLKVGDKVTWGVHFASRDRKPATISFTLVEKPQIARAEAKLAAAPNVSGVVEDLARANILMNYRLYSEAVSVYVGVLEQDERVTTAYSSIAVCLQSLKLKSVPLYDFARRRMPPRFPAR